MSQGWFSMSSGDQQKEQQNQSGSSLLADWNSYAASRDVEEGGGSFGFDIESAVRSANDTVSGTFSVVSKGVRDIPGSLSSATSSMPSGKALMYFGLLLASGVFFIFIAFTMFLPVMVLMPQKFAICFTLGCGFIIGSFFALRGPQNQLAHMTSMERLPLTIGFIAISPLSSSPFAMAYNKKHVKIGLWPEKEEKEKKYSKNREALKLTVPTFLLFCSICLIFLILLSPFTSPPQTSFTASSLPRTCDQNFTVYVYDLPKEFNTNLLQNCRHLNIYTDMCPHVANNGLGQPLHRGGGDSETWFATHQFIAEMIFHARVKNHPCRTWEPNNADIFYVPFYGGLYASSVFREYNLTKRDELAVRLVDYMSGQRWWGRSNGRDHLLAFGRTAWDFMRSSDEAGTDFGANILMQLPLVRNMSVLTVERQPWDGDNQFGIPYPSYFHPYTSAEMLTWQDKMRSVERPHLFSFVGGPRKGLEKAAIRDELIRQCADSSRCELLKCESGGSRCHDPMTVLGVMARSRFCLQAPGDSFTRRSTFDAMLAGCIPVFFSPHTMYTQYMWYLPDDKRSYSVFMDEKNSTLIEQELSRISESEVVHMREAVIAMIPKMTYAHPNATNYDLPDAVDVALEALAMQAKTKVVYSL